MTTRLEGCGREYMRAKLRDSGGLLQCAAEHCNDTKRTTATRRASLTPKHGTTTAAMSKATTSLFVHMVRGFPFLTPHCRNPSNSAARPFQRYYDKYWFMDEKAPK